MDTISKDCGPNHRNKAALSNFSSIVKTGPELSSSIMERHSSVGHYGFYQHPPPPPPNPSMEGRFRQPSFLLLAPLKFSSKRFKILAVPSKNFFPTGSVPDGGGVGIIKWNVPVQIHAGDNHVLDIPDIRSSTLSDLVTFCSSNDWDTNSNLIFESKTL